MSMPKRTTYGIRMVFFFHILERMRVYENDVNRLKYGKPVANAHWFGFHTSSFCCFILNSVGIWLTEVTGWKYIYTCIYKIRFKWIFFSTIFGSIERARQINR